MADGVINHVARMLDEFVQEADCLTECLRRGDVESAGRALNKLKAGLRQIDIRIGGPHSC